VKKDPKLKKPETKAYDWTKTTKSDFDGTYKIKSGDLSMDAKRIFKCIGKDADCQKTQPSLDKDRKIWSITQLKGKEFTADEIKAKQKPPAKCFDYKTGDPLLQSDIVCDPQLPTKFAWTCMDATKCADTKPDLNKAKENEKTWKLIKGSDAVIEKREPPKQGDAVTCNDFEQKAKDEDISKQQKFIWCSKGRAYKCIEPATEKDTGKKDAKGNAIKEKTYPGCSGEKPEFGVKSGTWELLRQKATVNKLSKDDINKRFGAKKETGRCMPDETFKKDHASW